MRSLGKLTGLWLGLMLGWGGTALAAPVYGVINFSTYPLSFATTTAYQYELLSQPHIQSGYSFTQKVNNSSTTNKAKIFPLTNPARVEYSWVGILGYFGLKSTDNSPFWLKSLELSGENVSMTITGYLKSNPVTNAIATTTLNATFRTIPLPSSTFSKVDEVRVTYQVASTINSLAHSFMLKSWETAAPGSPGSFTGFRGPNAGTYKAGQNLDFVLVANSNVTVTGSPVLQIQVGSALRNAGYLSGSGTTELTFRYTVQEGENDTDGVAVSGVDLAGGSLISNDLDVQTTLAYSTTAVIVDSTPPVLTSLSGASFLVSNGQNLDVNLNFSENIQYTGSPRLVLRIGSTERYALAVTTSRRALVMRYPPQYSEIDSDGVEFLEVQLNGGTISDLAGNATTNLSFTANKVSSLPRVDTLSRGITSGQMGDSLPVVDLGSGQKALQIVAGDFHTCALLESGAVKCWGLNAFGQLGQGNKINLGTTANQMGNALSAIDLGAGRKALQLTSGREHVCAILDDSSLKCWGANYQGQVGPQNY